MNPSLGQLQYLGREGDFEDDVVRVIEEVCYKWKELGDCLEFRPGQIRAVGKNHQTCEEACRAIFEQWLQGEGRQPANWGTLINILREADPKFNEFSDRLVHVLSVLNA